MAPEIVAVPSAQKPDLWVMFQTYAAELAPMVNMAPVDGVFPYERFDDYWREDKHWPFWAVKNGARIGFALVRFAPELDAMQMAEFFILLTHRKGGSGLHFAQGVLARFPGPWKIRQIVANKVATAFWRRVAEPYGYTEEMFPHKGIDRIEQTLTVR